MDRASSRIGGKVTYPKVLLQLLLGVRGAGLGGERAQVELVVVVLGQEHGRV